MADLNARTRLLVGTTAAWASADLVLGDGELVLERAGGLIKMKAGDGAARYSALPFVTMTPTIPPEYVTQDEGDARYLQLAGVSATSAPNLVPRMDGSGMLPAAMVPLPPAISSTTGTPDAGKLVKTAASGKIDPTFITVTMGRYRGVADATLPPPPGTYIAGDYFVNTGSGLADSTWGLASGTTVAPAQQLVYNGSQWALVGSGSATIVQLPDGSAPAPSLAFVNDTNTGLYLAGADVLGLATNGTEVARFAATTARLFGSPYGTLGLRKNGGVYGGTGPSPLRDGLVIEAAFDTGISILTPSGRIGGIVFGDNDANDSGGIAYNHTNDTFSINTLSTPRLSINAAGATFAPPLRAPDGTMVLPALSFASDTGLGLYRPAASTLGFATAGGEKMRLLGVGDGSLLVGTTSVTNTSAGRGVVEVNGSVDSLLMLSVGGAGSAYLNANAGQCNLNVVGASRSLTFGTNGGERARVTPGGYLLVGMTASTQAPSAARGIVEVNGSQDAAYTLCTGGALSAFLLSTATSTTLANVNAGATLAIQIAGANQLAVNATTLMDAINGVELGWRDFPANSQTGAAYTLAQSDRGRMVVMGNTGNSTLTVPALPVAPATVAEAYTVMYVAGGPGTFLTINAGSGATFFWGAGSPNNGATRKLAYCGVMTLVRLGGGNNWFITGTGIS